VTVESFRCKDWYGQGNVEYHLDEVSNAFYFFVFKSSDVTILSPPPKYIILHALFEDSVHRFSKLCRNFAQPFQCRFLRGMLLQLFAI